MLDYFEEELGHDGRVGCWLGGGQICVADITLGGYNNIIEGSKITFLHTLLFTGLYLHRLYQLGLDTAYYQGDKITSEGDDDVLHRFRYRGSAAPPLRLLSEHQVSDILQGGAALAGARRVGCSVELSTNIREISQCQEKPLYSACFKLREGSLTALVGCRLDCDDN